MQDFRNLTSWRKAHNLTLAIYKATKSFPREEVYGLTSQLRRAVASIPTNIAEGCGRAGTNDFTRFLQIAAGSASEVEYLLFLAHDLNFLEDTRTEELLHDVSEIRRMLAALIRKLKLRS